VQMRLTKYLIDNPSVVIEFTHHMKELTKAYGEAKDNVKFLTTLERQFKNLDQEGLVGIEETLPSLMNGLKMVWIISRHYKEGDKMINLLTLISDEIADKVETSIKITKLFRLIDDLPYESQLEASKQLIVQGQRILTSWRNLYRQTRLQIEEDGLERWDFQVKAITERIENMIQILEQLQTVAEILKKFLVFLGPNLKAVTGDSEGIDNLVLEVK
jgi:dynein heavy chain